MKRRNFIRLAGGGVVVAAVAVAGVLSVRSISGVPATAVAAWQVPDAKLDIRRWALSYALLAPNPHNRQPWQADLSVADQITLTLDPKRLLPATDPFGRQILMGAGAFLELLKMAAAEQGYAANWTLFPDGEPAQKLDSKAFAVVRLVKEVSVQRDPLFAQVLLRRTDRRAYDPVKAVDAKAGDALQAAVQGLPVRFGLSNSVAQLEGIRRIVRDAWQIELTTEATMMESMHLLRVGSKAIDANRDGIAITSPMLVALSKIGLLDTNKFPAPDSQATQGQIKNFDVVTASTPAYLWLSTEGNSRIQQIEAGRAYARLNLAGTQLGLAMHPNEQSLQEYPEVSKPYAAIHALLGAAAPQNTVQMLARVGYLPAGSAMQEPAPRRGLGAHLLV
jgi:hypothetical protein